MQEQLGINLEFSVITTLDILSPSEHTWNVIEMDILGHHNHRVGGAGAGQDGLEISGTRGENHLTNNRMWDLSVNTFAVHPLVGLNFPLLQATNKADILELWNHGTLSPSSNVIFLSTDLKPISDAWTTFRYLSENHSSGEQSSPDYPCCFNNSIKTFKTSFACLKSRHYVVLSNIIN